MENFTNSILLPENLPEIDKYEPIILLGSGKFGDVFYAKENISKKGVAIKLMNKEDIMINETRSDIEREIQILTIVKHPFIIQMKEHFEDEDYVYIILEYCSKGDLYNLIKLRPINETVCKKYVREIVEAVKEISLDIFFFSRIKF